MYLLVRLLLLPMRHAGFLARLMTGDLPGRAALGAVSPSRGEDREVAQSDSDVLVHDVLVHDGDRDETEETVLFSLDGAVYEIDLSASGAAALRAVLRPYVDAARRVRRPRPATRSKASPPGLSKADRVAVREWSRSAAAAKEGIEPVGERGRIPVKVIAAWQANRAAGPARG